MMPLETALLETCRKLDELRIPYMIIGGIAAGAWGNPRGTVDVDATISAEGKSVEEVLGLLQSRFAIPNADALALLQSAGMIRAHTSNGVAVDLVLAQFEYQTAAMRRAVPVNVGGSIVKFCTPEDLILHKVISDRSLDQKDAREVLFRRWRSLDLEYVRQHLQRISEKYDERAPLTVWDRMVEEVRDVMSSGDDASGSDG